MFHFNTSKIMEATQIYPKIDGVTYITQKQLCERTGYVRQGLRLKLKRLGIEPIFKGNRALYPLSQIEQAIDDGLLIKYL